MINKIVINKFHEIKKKKPEAVLLFHVKNYYEAYEDDAEVVACILGLPLIVDESTKIRLSNFPENYLDKYLPKLVAKKRVAVVEPLGNEYV